MSYDEIFFDTELSSIWSDSTQNDLWIGGENGELFLVEDNVIKWRRELKSGRIYKIVPLKTTPTDTTLLIGIRNEGLQLWKFSGDNKPQVTRYSIEYKGCKYSAYDFQNTSGNAYYVGTSNGCYYIDFDAAKPQMQLSFPTETLLDKKYNYEYPVYNLQKQNDGTVVGASPQGVFWLCNQYTPIAKRDSIIFSAKNTTFVSVHGDTILALSENKIYKHCKGQTYLPLDCKNNPKIYFEDNAGNKWLIASRSIRIGRQLKDNFEDIELPKSIPFESQRNIIVCKTEFTYLITQNSLWRIPVHLNIYNSPTISAVCQNGLKQVFFVTSANQLFKKTTDNNAEYIKQIDVEGHIVWIAACDKYLYFHTGTNMIYYTPISSSIFSLNKEKPLYPAIQIPNNILTAYLHYDTINNKKVWKLFFGTRDGLGVVNLPLGKIDTSLIKGKYVSTLSNIKNDDLLAGTLNDGLFVDSTHAGWKQKNSKNIDLNNKLIQDIVSIDKEKLLILTNHYVFYDTDTGADSIPAKGFRKILLVNDSIFFAVANKGFAKYRINKGKIEQQNARMLYRDISFIPNACMVLDKNSLLLGSALGCLHYDVNKKTSSWVNIEKPRLLSILERSLMTVIAIIAFAFFSIILLGFSKEKKEKKDKISNRQNNLKKRVVRAKKLIEYITYFPDNQETIYRLNEVIKKCNNIESASDKDLYNNTLTNVDEILMEINDQITLLFQNELSSQISAILNQNISILYDETKQAEKALIEKNTGEIRKIVIKNIKWFNHSQTLKANYDGMLKSLRNCYEVPKVNEKLYNNLSNAIIHLNNTELEICQKECLELIQRYNYIESPEATKQINLFLEQTVGQLRQKTDRNNLYGSIINLLKELEAEKNKTENKKVLEILDEIMNELPAIESLCNIKLLVEEFFASNNKTKKEEVCKKINEQIDRFYAELPEDIDELLTNELKIIGTTKAGKALALTLADRNIKGAAVGRLIGDAKPLNLEGITSKTRTYIRSEESKQKIEKFSKNKNDRSIILLLLIEL
ncbi:MAG: hypothetical protein PHX50_14090 [Massilibacteroides sp.]|nr:hypothetical protein [Massilibacteroides sp.]